MKMTEDEFSEKLRQLLVSGKAQEVLNTSTKYQHDGGIPNSIDWAYMGWASKMLNNTDMALEYFDNIIKGDESDIENRYLLGAAYFQKADIFDDMWRKTNDQALLKKAQEFFNKCIECDPGETWAYYNLGCIECLIGNLANAIKYLASAISASPKEILASIATDSDLQNLKNNETFQELISIDPDKIDHLARRKEDFPIDILAMLCPSWESEPHSLLCPICAEEHQYILKVARVIAGFKGSPDFYTIREFRTTRIFFCPNEKKPFIADIIFKETYGSLIAAIVVE